MGTEVGRRIVDLREEVSYKMHGKSFDMSDTTCGAGGEDYSVKTYISQT